jgi:hypothetical protein
MSMDATSSPWPDASHLPDDPALLQRMIQELLATLQSQKREMEQIRYRLSLLLQRVYGPRRERINPDQLSLFTDLLEGTKCEEPLRPDEEEAESAPTGQRRGHGRRELPTNLPRSRPAFLCWTILDTRMPARSAKATCRPRASPRSRSTKDRPGPDYWLM